MSYNPGVHKHIKQQNSLKTIKEHSNENKKSDDQISPRIVDDKNIQHIVYDKQSSCHSNQSNFNSSLKETKNLMRSDFTEKADNYRRINFSEVKAKITDKSIELNQI